MTQTPGDSAFVAATFKEADLEIARLMAITAQLLEALEAAVDFMERTGSWGKTIEQCRAAIKATTEE